MRWCGFATYRWLVKNCILIGNTVSCIRGSAIFFNRSIEHHVVKTGIEFEHLPGCVRVGGSIVRTRHIEKRVALNEPPGVDFKHRFWQQSP